MYTKIKWINKYKYICIFKIYIFKKHKKGKIGWILKKCKNTYYNYTDLYNAIISTKNKLMCIYYYPNNNTWFINYNK